MWAPRLLAGTVHGMVTVVPKISVGNTVGSNAKVARPVTAAGVVTGCDSGDPAAACSDPAQIHATHHAQLEHMARRTRRAHLGEALLDVAQRGHARETASPFGSQQGQAARRVA